MPTLPSEQPTDQPPAFTLSDLPEPFRTQIAEWAAQWIINRARSRAQTAWLARQPVHGGRGDTQSA